MVVETTGGGGVNLTPSLLGLNNEGNIVSAGDLVKGGLFDLLK